MRRDSTGKMGSSCIRQPVVSRYLRASVGSCHDLCKHGAEKRDMDSTSRKKSAGSVNGGGVVRGEIVGNVVKPKIGREKGSSPRSGLDRCNGRGNITMKRASSMRVVLNAGKARSDVPDVGALSNDKNELEGEGPKETRLRTSNPNLADVNVPATVVGLSPTKKKVKLPTSPPARKNIERSRSGGNLTQAPSLLSMSSLESVSVRGKTGIKVRKGVALDNMDSPGKKRSFRRGTSLEDLSDNHSQRRLGFRQPMLRESQIGSSDARRKNFRKVEVRVADVKSRKQERVVLRHRAVEKRQDGRRLFNNVIEETASKLVKARKGKVKALVGAFETVISLQEKKKLQATVTVC